VPTNTQTATSKPTTMSTIAINQTLETAVKTMLNKHATDCVVTLAEKYGFDLEEALRELDLESAKIVKKEKSSPKASPSASPKTESKSTKGKGQSQGGEGSEGEEAKEAKWLPSLHEGHEA